MVSAAFRPLAFAHRRNLSGNRATTRSTEIYFP
jgi:hypothetical protein